MSFSDLPRRAARFTCRFGKRAGLLGLTTLLWAVSTAAHEGHDHGSAAPLPASVKARVAIETDLYQLVAIAGGGQLMVFLDSYGTNEPVTDAAIGVLAGNQSITAKPRSDGSYVAAIPSIGSPGKHELVFNVSHKRGDDLLAGHGVTHAAARAGRLHRTAAAADDPRRRAGDPDRARRAGPFQIEERGRPRA